MSGQIFDLEWEEDVLAQCTRDREFLRVVAQKIGTRGHIWSSAQHGWVWKVIEQVWSAHGETCDGRTFLSASRRDHLDPAKRAPHVSLATRLLGRAVAAPRTALAELEGFVDFATLQSGMEQAAEALERGEIGKVREILSRATRTESNPRGYQDVRWIEEFEDRQRLRKERRDNPDKYPVVPTGIGKLDALLDGGAYPHMGDLGIAVGTTSVGKSMLIMNFGMAAVFRKIHSAIMSLEMPAHQVAQRCDARFTGFLYRKFKLYDFTDDELETIRDRMDTERARLSGMLRIQSMPLGTCTLEMLRARISALKDEQPDLKLIVVDSGDHIVPSRHYEQKRHAHTEAFEGLKNIAETEEVVIWSSVHASKEWAGRIGTAEAVGEDYNKARLASIIVTLNEETAGGKRARVLVDDDESEPQIAQTPEEPAVRRQRLYLAKSRDGDARKHIPLDSDFARSTVREAAACDD